MQKSFETSLDAGNEFFSRAQVGVAVRWLREQEKKEKSLKNHVDSNAGKSCKLSEGT